MMFVLLTECFTLPGRYETGLWSPKPHWQVPSGSKSPNTLTEPAKAVSAWKACIL